MSVYVDLQYDEIYLTFPAGSVCYCDVCSHVVVLEPYVDVVVAVTVMRVLLFVLHVCMLRGCEGVMVTEMQSCCTLSISAYFHVFVCGRYRKSRLSWVLLSDPDNSRYCPL